MIIVNRVEFLKLPENTLYSEYEPCSFDDIKIKGKTLLTNDWINQQIVDAIDCTGSDDFVDKLELARIDGVSLKMDFNCEGRNGCFEPDIGLFAIYEQDDIKSLILRLQQCLIT